MTAPAAPEEPRTFRGQFMKFLTETNALSLALGVVIGGAMGKLVTSITDGLIMPIVSLALPGGDWRSWKVVLREGTPGPDCGVPGKVCTMVGEKALQLGAIIGSTLDFIIIALVVFILAKKLMNIEVKK